MTSTARYEAKRRPKRLHLAHPDGKTGCGRKASTVNTSTPGRICADCRRRAPLPETTP